MPYSNEPTRIKPPASSTSRRPYLVHLLDEGGILHKVRAAVLAATAGKQRPFEDSSLTEVGLFCRAAGK
jgi:hypothetical protein